MWTEDVMDRFLRFFHWWPSLSRPFSLFNTQRKNISIIFTLLLFNPSMACRCSTMFSTFKEKTACIAREKMEVV